MRRAARLKRAGGARPRAADGFWDQHRGAAAAAQNRSLSDPPQTARAAPKLRQTPRLIGKGDLVIVMGFELAEEAVQARKVLVDARNRFVRYV